MARASAEDTTEQKLLDDIRRYGWHCAHVLADDGGTSFSFSVGLFQTYRHPELVIFGLRSEVAHRVLNVAVAAAQAGRPFDLAEPTAELVEGYPCVFVRVPDREYKRHFGLGIWYYMGNAFPVYQAVYPSRTWHFPWQSEATDSFKALQPVLGAPPVGR